MLFPSEMSQVTILTHQNQSAELVNQLHRAGLMEISWTKREDVEEGRMHPEVDACASRVLRLTRIIDILKQYRKSTSGIRAMLRPSIPDKQSVPSRTMEEKIAAADELIEDLESFVIDTEEQIEDIDKQVEEIAERQAKLEKLAAFDVDLSWLGVSRYLVVQAGVSSDVEALQASLPEDVVMFSRPVDKEEWAVVLVVHRADEEQLQKVKYFDEITVTASDSPLQLLESLEQEKKDLQEQRDQLVDSLRDIYQNREADILAIREEIQLEKEEKELPERFGQTRYTTLIEGWCLASETDRLEHLTEETTDGEAHFSARIIKREEEGPPIHLETPSWAGSFRTFLELFALPKYNEVNPSIFLGVSLILFFAIMLGDAGYGLVILILSAVAYVKLGPYSTMIKDWSFLGVWLGISTTVAGLLFNAFFGDFIPRFIYGDPTQMLYHATILGYDFPVDALRKPLIILVLALIIGLIPLDLGFVVALYQNYKRGHMKNILLEQISWFLLQIGGGALLGSSLLSLWELSTPMMIVSSIFTVIGLLALFIGQGPIGFFDVTGFAGDWLSYARLLALGLATAGMALAFNIVADLMPQIIPYVGIVLLPVVLVVAHLANLALQSLGAAIHALRLQYVEFFNRFYEGGGKKFEPFQIERKYTEEPK